MRTRLVCIILWAFPLLWASLPASESLGQADGALNANWSNSNNIGTTMNVTSHIAAATATQYTGVFWNADTFSADQYSRVTVGKVGAGSYIGAAVRITATGGSTQSYYACDVQPTLGTWFLYRIGNAYTQYATGTAGTLNVGDTIRLDVQRSTLTCRLNNTVLGTATDSTLTSGSAGMSGYGTGSGASAWTGGNVPHSYSSAVLVGNARFVGNTKVP